MQYLLLMFVLSGLFMYWHIALFEPDINANEIRNPGKLGLLEDKAIMVRWLKIAPGLAYMIVMSVISLKVIRHDWI